MIALIGIFDDLIGWKTGIRQWQHAVLPIFAALPLMAINIANPALKVPFIGLVDFGILYSILLVPIGITGAANAVNMLGGLNGLEAGLGAIITLTLGIIALIYGKPEAAILCFLMLAALIAFLWFNWYPAKIFGGDSLTLMIGATIGAASIIGDLEKIGILLMIIYFIELLIKAKHRFKSECFGIPQENGVLMANPKGGSLTHFIMKHGKFNEKQVVLILLAAQAIVSISVMLASVFHFIYI
jgi:UDP-N-acetylglucosamine--dolichyl-phosphate N-acetylglucosaminephosphotransferase